MADTDTYYKDATTQPKEDADAMSLLATLREQVSDLTRRAAALASETGEAPIETLDDAIRENPYLTLGFALLAGIAIGVALKR
jgi:ElaB/YqjD/DUF883 family membrane-anchored ribosome-binding protein